MNLFCLPTLGLICPLESKAKSKSYEHLLTYNCANIYGMHWLYTYDFFSLSHYLGTMETNEFLKIMIKMIFNIKNCIEFTLSSILNGFILLGQCSCFNTIRFFHSKTNFNLTLTIVYKNNTIRLSWYGFI